MLIPAEEAAHDVKIFLLMESVHDQHDVVFGRVFVQRGTEKQKFTNMRIS